MDHISSSSQAVQGGWFSQNGGVRSLDLLLAENGESHFQTSISGFYNLNPHILYKIWLENPVIDF